MRQGGLHWKAVQSLCWLRPCRRLTVLGTFAAATTLEPPWPPFLSPTRPPSRLMRTRELGGAWSARFWWWVHRGRQGRQARRTCLSVPLTAFGTRLKSCLLPPFQGPLHSILRYVYACRTCLSLCQPACPPVCLPLLPFTSLCWSLLVKCRMRHDECMRNPCSAQVGCKAEAQGRGLYCGNTEEGVFISRSGP